MKGGEVIYGRGVAQAFPNEEAVNSALLSLIDPAQKTTRPTRRSTESAKKLRGWRNEYSNIRPRYY